jgi:hypothetical protein
MDCKFEVKPTLAWADGYEEAEDYEDDSQDEVDETVQDLAAAHELWVALLKSWAEAGGCL